MLKGLTPELSTLIDSIQPSDTWELIVRDPVGTEANSLNEMSGNTEGMKSTLIVASTLSVFKMHLDNALRFNSQIRF